MTNSTEMFKSGSLFSPTGSNVRLDRPLDERIHARRPSDEGERILRKISGTGASRDVVCTGCCR